MRIRYLAIIVLAWSVGCSTAPPPRTPGMEAIGVDITTAELRQKIYRFESVFAATVHRAADEIFANESDHDIREMSIRWKINAVPTIQAAVFQLDPLAGLADAWGLTAQMENFFTTGAGKALFGSSQPIAVEASRALHAEIRAMVRSIVGQEKAGDVEPQLKAWIDENPILDISFGRRSTAIDAASVTAAEWGTGGLQSVGQIQELVRDLSDRLTIYAAQQPELARSHAELLTIEADRYMLAPVWEDIASVDRSIASVDERIKNIDAFIESSPELIATEREAIVAALQSELTTALVDVDRQREETIAALSGEREIVLDYVSSLSTIVLDSFDEARVATTTDVEAVVERQAVALVTATEGLINMVFWRALTLLVVGLVGLAIVLRSNRRAAAA